MYTINGDYDATQDADHGIIYDPECSGWTPEYDLSCFVEYMTYLGISPEMQERELRLYRAGMEPNDPRLALDGGAR